MPQILTGADPATINALLYGERHPGTQQFINNQMEAPTNMLTDAGRSFFQRTQSAFETLQDSTIMRSARAAKRALGSIWQNEEIRALTTIGEMQWAPFKMQRWIMAEPTVRKMYLNQQVEGYEGSYRDPFPGDIGEEHYDYRRVMNGVVVDTEDGWSATTYIDDLLPDDRELSMDEQIDILDTWAHVRSLIKKGKEDPTSKWNADL